METHPPALEMQPGTAGMHLFKKGKDKADTERNHKKKMHYFIAPRSWQYLGDPEEEVEEYGDPAHIQTQPHRMMNGNSP